MSEPEHLDADALRRRYEEERARRMREQEVDQYVELSGDFAGYAVDPYAVTAAVRPPVSERVEVLIIGAGYGGELAAAHLIKNGIDDIRIVDRAGDFGGTWYWNRYPGAACDTESYIYMPLLEDVGRIPTMKYALGPELFEHARAVARHFDLYDRALFQTEVCDLSWDDVAQLWRVTTDRGDRIAARHVITAIGSLSKPKLPGIPGIETFAGHSFHTSRWDYAYSGGDPRGNLDRLADQRVGIIGTGATAVQCVPRLAESAGHLYVFQRTPSVIDVRNDRPTDPEWVQGLTPGWQTERMENFNTIVSGGKTDIDLVNDGWTDLLGTFPVISGASGQGGPSQADQLELVDLQKMEKIRARVGSLVENRDVAEALKPYFSLFCKRPCFHDEYLQVFNRENVTLVDTRGRGVERVTPAGVVVDGIEYPLDLLIYSTGFEVNAPYTRRGGFSIHGRGGLSLDEKWADGPRTLHGFLTRDFPNLFIISQMQGGAAANFTHMLGEQARHVAWIITECARRGLGAVEPERAAEDAWVDQVLELGQRRRGYNEKCTPGYYNNEGHLTDRTIRGAPYGGGPLAFLEVMKGWRAAGTMPGLSCTPLVAELVGADE